MKKIIAISLSLVVGAFVIYTQASAQVPSLLPSDSPTPETTENLRERIEKIVEEQKEKVQSLLGSETSTRQGFIGEVTRVSEETVAIESRGATRIVPLDEGVELMLGNSAIKPDAIEVGSWALVLGLRRQDSFVPKKIIFSRTSLRPSMPMVYLATLKDIKTTTIDFQPRGDETTVTAEVTRTTQFQDNTGETVRLADFVVDDQVLIVGYRDEEDTVITVMRALAPLTNTQ